jgi:hypothetical protein
MTQPRAPAQSELLPDLRGASWSELGHTSLTGFRGHSSLFGGQSGVDKVPSALYGELT